MQEVEAIRHWCPLARVRADLEVMDGADRIGTGAGNRDVNDLCIASRCMAWRWLKFENARPDVPVIAGGGYCGAFGRER